MRASNPASDSSHHIRRLRIGWTKCNGRRSVRRRWGCPKRLRLSGNATCGNTPVCGSSLTPNSPDHSQRGLCGRVRLTPSIAAGCRLGSRARTSCRTGPLSRRQTKTEQRSGPISCFCTRPWLHSRSNWRLRPSITHRLEAIPQSRSMASSSTSADVILCDTLNRWSRSSVLHLVTDG